MKAQTTHFSALCDALQSAIYDIWAGVKKLLLMLNKFLAERPVLKFWTWLKQMSQSEGQKKAASKLTQPLNKEEIRHGSPEGMKEWSRGDETQEDESKSETWRHQRTERIKQKCLEVGALEMNKLLRWLLPLKVGNKFLIFCCCQTTEWGVIHASDIWMNI